MNQKNIILKGIFPPIPTPFDNEGNININALNENFRYWNRFNLRGYLVLGSNGEATLLSLKEKLNLFEEARKNIPDDRVMIAGTGCQSTQETAALCKEAAKTGADCVLVLNPYYYKGRMTQDALTNHYYKVADNSPVPVLIYNMPANTGIDMDAGTICRIAEHPNIYGLKDSGGNIVKMGEIKRNAGEKFQILAGSASFLLPALSVGATGGILALANISPEKCISVYENFIKGDIIKAREEQLSIISTNTAVTKMWGVPALKAAMDYLGLYGGPVREPLLPLTENEKEKLFIILRECGIKKF